ncbi:MAG TPA: hypothetical protein VH419_04330, partial [Nocardioidaceae bacterium]
MLVTTLTMLTMLTTLTTVELRIRLSVGSCRRLSLSKPREAFDFDRLDQRLGGLDTLSRVTLRLYDTATREVRDFVPLEAGQVGIYHCGLTVQGPPHIGHIRKE